MNDRITAVTLYIRGSDAFDTSRGLNKGKTCLTGGGNEWVVVQDASQDLANTIKINTEGAGRGNLGFLVDADAIDPDQSVFKRSLSEW